MIDASTLKAEFLSSPGDDLVDKTIMQLMAVPQLKQLFGNSVANYNRFDWPVHELPALNILEAQSENKTSDNGYLTGTIQIQAYWPSEFRRSDLMRVPNVFKGVLENFFSSKYVGDMLDELATIQRPAKVYGLNEYGKTLTWSPNVEGINDGELTPVTILDVQYRIDLRAWERALEYMGRTASDPFRVSLDDLSDLLGNLEGVDNNTGKPALVTVPIAVTINED
jgi:hypothetical protein